MEGDVQSQIYQRHQPFAFAHNHLSMLQKKFTKHPDAFAHIPNNTVRWVTTAIKGGQSSYILRSRRKTSKHQSSAADLNTIRQSERGRKLGWRRVTRCNLIGRYQSGGHKVPTVEPQV